MFQIIWTFRGRWRRGFVFWDTVLNWYTNRTSFLEEGLGQLQEKIEDCQILCLNLIFELSICFRNLLFSSLFDVYAHNIIFVEVLLYWVRSLEIKWFGGVFFLVCTWEIWPNNGINRLLLFRYWVKSLIVTDNYY